MGDTIIYNKLVRDKIPDRIAEEGKQVVLTIVKGEDELQAMRNKISEESNELVNAQTAEEVLSEMADLFEIMLAYGLRHGINESQLCAEVNRKKNLSGGFEDGKFLLSVSSGTLKDTVWNQNQPQS